MDTFSPTRLIYVGTRALPILRICEDVPHGARYATLSHRWGDANPICLLSSNIASYKLDLSTNLLPKKFHDAMEVTWHLGLQYLWVDSLCIVQDSVQDWLAESALMGQIYMHAHINIAGTTGTPNGEGLFCERDIHYIEPCVVLYEPSDLLPGGCFNILDQELWFRNVDKAPLNLRAWVCQERLLSPRTVHFARGQLFWECGEKVACELFPRRIPPGLYNAHPKRLNLELLRSGGLYERRQSGDLERWGFAKALAVWAGVVFIYTFAELTVETDKLIAISALAWCWQHLVGGNIQYLAGMWRKNFATQLLWRSFGGVYASIQQEEWRAPSWSWASINGPILMPQMTRFEDERDILIDIKETSVELVSKERFGPVKDGRITLCGRLAKIAVRSTMDNAIYVRGVSKPSYRMMVELDCCIDTKAVAILNSNYEDDAWVEGLFRGLYFMPIRADQHFGEEHQMRTAFVEGLILEKLQGSHNTFKRWGLGEIEGSRDGNIFEEAFKNFDMHAEESGLEYYKTAANSITHYRVDII